jgi:pyrroline-5-carboxylate reductase
MQVGFIGGGKMAEAMIAGLMRAGVARPDEVFVGEVLAERRRLLQERHGVNVCEDNGAVLRQAATVFLAVKPQALDAVCQTLAPHATEEHLFISIAAGKRLQRLEALLPRARLVRVMPNLPVLVAAGMSVFCAGARATAADRRTVTALLVSFGQALELPEERFDAVTALSGSGPAFVACFLEAMAAGAARLGLERPHADLLAAQTLLGTALLLTRGGFGTADLIKAVSSAKGTTVAGLQVLDQPATRDLVFSALEAAARRSRELSQESHSQT